MSQGIWPVHGPLWRRKVLMCRDVAVCVRAGVGGPAVHLWAGRARRKELVPSTGGQGVAEPSCSAVGGRASYCAGGTNEAVSQGPAPLLRSRLTV